MANFAIFISRSLYIVSCETLQSTTDIIVKLTSTIMGSNATYQCRDGSSDVYTTQCTSDGVWEPNPNSTLDCTPPGKMVAVFYLYNCAITDVLSEILYYLFIISVLCEILQSTENITVNFASTKIGSNATYQCRDGSSDVYTTQCTSDGVWEPNPNSTLDCTMTDHGVPMHTRVIAAVIILVIVAGITIVVVAVFYWRIRNKTSELQYDCAKSVALFSL